MLINLARTTFKCGAEQAAVSSGPSSGQFNISKPFFKPHTLPSIRRLQTAQSIGMSAAIENLAGLPKNKSNLVEIATGWYTKAGFAARVSPPPQHSHPPISSLQFTTSELPEFPFQTY